MDRYKDYAVPGSDEDAALRMHFEGMRPSEIAAALGIEADEARAIVSAFWKWDKSRSRKAVVSDG